MISFDYTFHSLDHVRVELPVPGTEEGRGHVQPLAVEAELQHLSGAADRLALQVETLRLILGTIFVLEFLPRTLNYLKPIVQQK